MLYREYYMALSVSHPVSTRDDTNIIPRALARGMILVEGWYGMWYGKSHIILCFSFITYLKVIMSILPIRKHRKCHSDICHRGKTLITRYQASREPHDVTSAQLLIVVWKMSTFSEDRFVGVSEAESSTDIDHSYP